MSRVARDLRGLALAAAPGTFLGNTEKLAAQLNVSRPTFRQAAKILEHEQLLVVRTGIGGGFFVRQPDTAAVAHMTDVYLRSRDTTVEHVIAIFNSLFVLVSQTAAARCSRELKPPSLDDFIRQDADTMNQPLDWRTHVSSQVELVDVLADLSDNPLLKLFFTVTREMLMPYYLETMAPPKPELIARALATRFKLAKVVRDGEPEFAEALARRYISEANSWLSADKALHLRVAAIAALGPRRE